MSVSALKPEEAGLHEDRVDYKTSCRLTFTHLATGPIGDVEALMEIVFDRQLGKSNRKLNR